MVDLDAPELALDAAAFVACDSVPAALPELDDGSDAALETPKPSCAGGAGGVAGVLAACSASAPAAGLYSPQVCADRPSLSRALLPFSHLFLSFVFVWLVVWVGLSFVPLGVSLSGSSAIDAFVSFVFMLAWLLLCSLASLV